MRRRLTFSVVLVLLLAGCADRPVPAVPDGPPALPTTIDVADTPIRPLPTSGPIGRGALLYRSAQTPFEAVLLLENGQQFRLPAPPPGEGRQGSLYASLSPDGRWLG